MARTANGAFIEHSLAIGELLEKLQAHHADFFGVDPERDRNWGEVGSVESYRHKLADLVDCIERTGEYAP